MRNEWMKFSPKPRELTRNDQWNVFLSYRSINRSWVLSLYDVLKEHGHKVFLDQYVLKAGDSLISGLENALETSQSGVLIWSSATRESDWVKREYQVMERQAERKNYFYFIPVKLDASPTPPFLANRIHLDFSAYPEGPNGGELLRLLYAIVGKPLNAEAIRFSNEQDEAAREAEAEIQSAINHGQSEHLIELFENSGLPWLVSAILGCKAAEGLVRLGHCDKAIQLLDTLEKQFPKSIRPKQLKALALARRANVGDLLDAQKILGKLYVNGERDPETLGIYARTWMDCYEISQEIADLEKSCDLYSEAFEIAQDDYYTGINVAAKNVLLGIPEGFDRALKYARRVENIVGTKPEPGDYWKTVTIAEMFLIQKKYQDAGRTYEAAITSARFELGSKKTTWKQACRLMDKLQPTEEERAMISKAFLSLEG